MKYIMAQPAILRFEWETKAAVYALKKLGIKKEDIILLFSYVDETSNSVVNTLEHYGATTHLFSDTRTNDEKFYIPSLKPYLMYRYFSGVREPDSYLYMDSDVLIMDNIFTNMLLPDNNNWFGSDVGGYLNYDYITGCDKGLSILEGMANIVGTSTDWIKKNNENTIGGQYLIYNPNPDYFYKVYKDSVALWTYIKDIDTNYQKWCQEMVSTFWNMDVFDINPTKSDSMGFTWATDDYSTIWSNNILHNAGIIDDEGPEFFKGKFVNNYPSKKDLVTYSGKASDYYAETVMRALNY